MKDQEWILCPNCKNKTRTKIREDTTLSHFPLFCPKCRQGRELGKRLSDVLEISCYDKEIIQMIAKEQGFDEQYVSHVSEKIYRPHIR